MDAVLPVDDHTAPKGFGRREDYLGEAAFHTNSYDMRLKVKSALLGAAAAVIPVAILSLILLPPLSTAWRDEAARRRQESLRAAVAILDKRLVDLKSASQRLAEGLGNRCLVLDEQDPRVGHGPTVATRRPFASGFARALTSR